MRIINKYLDLLGFSASFLCAIHCMLLPLALSLGLAGSLPWLESHTMELILICSTLVMASWSLFGSLSKHGHYQPLFVAALGFIIILGVHLLEGNVAHYFSALGGILVAYAHYLNWRFLHGYPHFERKNQKLKTV